MVVGIEWFVYVLVIGVNVEVKVEYVEIKGEVEIVVCDVCLDVVILWFFIVFGLEDDFFNWFVVMLVYLIFLIVLFLLVIGGGYIKL